MSSISNCCSDTRRIAYLILLILLLFPVGNSIALSIHAYYEMKEASHTQSSIDTSLTVAGQLVTDQRRNTYNLSVWMTLSIGMLTVAVFGLWIVYERCVIPRESLLCQELRMFRIQHARFMDRSTRPRTVGRTEVEQPAALARDAETPYSGPQQTSNDVNTETNDQLATFTVGSF